MNFTEDTIILLKYKPDPAARVPEYIRYTLENVIVREIFIADSEDVEESSVTVYFLEHGSTCRSQVGESVPLPRLSKRDLCMLHAGTDAEVTMRVAEAGYFTGEGLSHVRMKLK